MRRRARKDANHNQVAEALEAAGWLVLDHSGVGNGWVDIVAVKHGRIRLIEVKDSAKPPSARKLTQDEQQLHDRLAKAGVQVAIVTSIEDAVRL